MYCSRPRCCKRTGLDFDEFKAVLLDGNGCPHCAPGFVSGNIKLDGCPNSNCQVKVRMGVASRKYNVGIGSPEGQRRAAEAAAAAAAAAATTPTTEAAKAEKRRKLNGTPVSSAAASALVSTIAHARDEHRHTIASAAGRVMAPSLVPLSLQAPVYPAALPAHTHASLAYSSSYTGAASPAYLLPLLPPTSMTSPHPTAAHFGANSSHAHARARPKHPEPAGTASSLAHLQSTSALDYQIAQLQAQNDASKQQVGVYASSRPQPCPYYNAIGSHSVSHVVSPSLTPASAPYSAGVAVGGLAALATGVAVASEPGSSKLPTTFHQFMVDSYENITKAMTAYVPIWAPTEVAQFMQHHMQMPLAICQQAITADLDGSRFLALTPHDLQSVLHLDPVFHRHEIDLLMTGVHLLKQHFDSIKLLSDQQHQARAAQRAKPIAHNTSKSEHDTQAKPSLAVDSGGGATNSDPNVDVSRSSPPSPSPSPDLLSSPAPPGSFLATLTAAAAGMAIHTTAITHEARHTKITSAERKMIPFAYSYNEYRQQQESEFHSPAKSLTPIADDPKAVPVPAPPASSVTDAGIPAGATPVPIMATSHDDSPAPNNSTVGTTVATPATVLVGTSESTEMKLTSVRPNRNKPKKR